MASRNHPQDKYLTLLRRVQQIEGLRMCVGCEVKWLSVSGRINLESVFDKNSGELVSYVDVLSSKEYASDVSDHAKISGRGIYYRKNDKKKMKFDGTNLSPKAFYSDCILENRIWNSTIYASNLFSKKNINKIIRMQDDTILFFLALVVNSITRIVPVMNQKDVLSALNKVDKEVSSPCFDMFFQVRAQEPVEYDFSPMGKRISMCDNFGSIEVKYLMYAVCRSFAGGKERGEQMRNFFMDDNFFNSPFFNKPLPENVSCFSSNFMLDEKRYFNYVFLVQALGRLGAKEFSEMVFFIVEKEWHRKYLNYSEWMNALYLKTESPQFPWDILVEMSRGEMESPKMSFTKRIDVSKKRFPILLPLREPDENEKLRENA